MSLDTFITQERIHQSPRHADLAATEYMEYDENGQPKAIELTPEQKRQAAEYLRNRWNQDVRETCRYYCGGDLAKEQALYDYVCQPGVRDKCINNMIELRGAAIFTGGGCSCVSGGAGIAFGFEKMEKITFTLAGTVGSNGFQIVPGIAYNDSAQIGPHTYFHWGAAVTAVGVGASVGLTQYFYQEYESLGKNWGEMGRTGSDYIMVGVGISTAGPGASIEFGRSMKHEIENREKDVRGALYSSFGNVRSTNSITIEGLRAGNECYYEHDAATFITNSLQGSLRNLGYDFAPAQVKREMMDEVINGIARAAAQSNAKRVEGRWQLTGLGVGISPLIIAPYLKFSKLTTDYITDYRSSGRVRKRKQLLTNCREMRWERGLSYAANVAKEWNNYLLADGHKVQGRQEGNIAILSAVEAGSIRVIKKGVSQNLREVRFDITKERPIIFDIHHPTGSETPTLCLQPVEGYVLQETKVDTKISKVGRSGNELVDRLNGLKYSAPSKLAEAARDLTPDQLVELLASDASQNLVSSVFRLVVKEMSESPTYFFNSTNKEQRLKIIQNVAVQGQFDELVSHPVAMERKHGLVLEAVRLSRGNANEYMKLLPALEEIEFDVAAMDVFESKAKTDGVFKDFIASYILSDVERVPAIPSNYQARFQTIHEAIETKRATGALDKVREKTTPTDIYIVYPKSLANTDDVRRAKKLADSNPKIHIKPCSGPGDINAFTGAGKNVAIIAIGEPWDMNAIMAGAKLEGVSTMFTRTCRGVDTWMIDARGKYPEMDVVANGNVGIWTRNDKIASTLCANLLDANKKTWSETTGALSEMPNNWFKNPDGSFDGSKYGDDVFFPHETFSETLRLMSHAHFDQSPSLRMSDKSKSKGTVVRSKTRYLLKNKALIVRDQITQQMLIDEKNFVLGFAFSRPADGAGTPEHAAPADDVVDPEVPNPVDPNPTGNPTSQPGGNVIQAPQGGGYTVPSQGTGGIFQGQNPGGTNYGTGGF